MSGETPGQTAGGEGDQYLLVGRVRKPHGVRGELFVWLETDRPTEIFRPGRELTLGDGEGRPGTEKLTVEKARPFKDGVLLKPVGYTSRTDEIEALRGRSLLVTRSSLPPPAADEVFYHDLIGLTVVAGEQEIGTVREVYEGAGTDLLEVDRGDAGELLVPFAADLVRRIDVAAGIIEIDPPAGLLEL